MIEEFTKIQEWILTFDGLKSIFGFVGTLFSVFIGALFAYKYQNVIEKRKEIKNQISLCQQALFFLTVVQENLHDLKKELEPYRKSASTKYDLPKIISCHNEILGNSTQLVFILHSEDANIVNLHATIEREFKKLVAIVLLRNSALDCNDKQQVIRLTEELYEQFERCYCFNLQVMEESHVVFKKRYGKVPFVAGVTNVVKR
ncbi:hypothetical protein [Vibrio sp. SCSIO 43137]|uniref:hypothetical protein n=1 Tax=Vibrio sp. SCSIO 43137 TaxID=3021011 RepID=UPI0023071770|nr:hypothetical protein [Vibrio sp. SCSIO 43137]WCE28788.1 hypothetical protein PK654_10500 [Vibrio sp. SCSIO 43137]